MCRTPDDRLAALFKTAEDVTIVHDINVNHYVRFMRSMFQLSNSYAKQGEKERAYILATRAAILFLERLPTHRHYNNLDPVQKMESKKLCNVLLKRAEILKEELREKYESEYSLYQQSLLLTNSQKSDEVNKSDASPEVNNVVSIENHGLPGFPSVPTENHNMPLIDRSVKPADSNYYFESSGNLTYVYLARNMIDDFLKLSLKNTQENRETCGTLCGRLIGACFHITNLLIPKQSGTSDSCTTYQEEEVFEYLDSRQLITLGWIHTHPTQTAFLSAVDQHCQLAYQAMLPEAIAIVCAPKFNDTKCFSLTSDHGIPFLSKCKKTGFHPHASPHPIYEPSRHVIFDDSIQYCTADLR